MKKNILLFSLFCTSIIAAMDMEHTTMNVNPTIMDIDPTILEPVEPLHDTYQLPSLITLAIDGILHALENKKLTHKEIEPLLQNEDYESLLKAHVDFATFLESGECKPDFFIHRSRTIASLHNRLKNYRCNLEATNTAGQTPLNALICNGDPKVATELLLLCDRKKLPRNAGYLDIVTPDKNGMTPLHNALIYDCKKLASLLINIITKKYLWQKVNATNRNTHLLELILNHAPELATDYMVAQAEIQFKDRVTELPTNYHAPQGHVRIGAYEELVEQVEDGAYDKLLTDTPKLTIAQKNKLFLLLAVITNNIHLVDDSWWAHINDAYDIYFFCENRKCTLLQLCVKSGISPETFNRLLAKRANPAILDSQKRSVLWYATCHKDPTTIDTLCRYPNIINQCDDTGETALMNALRDNDSELSLKLLPNSDTTHVTNRGDAIIHFAIYCPQLLEKLVDQHRSFLDKKNNKGRTPLHQAIKHNLFPVASTLIHDFKADIFLTDNKGRNAIHFAAKHNFDCLKLLLHTTYPHQLTKLINSPDNQGITPLMIVVGRNNTNAVILLVNNGADKTMKDHQGRTASDYITPHASEDLIRFLQGTDES